MKNNINNSAVISGCVCGGFEFSHELYGERFYLSHIMSARESGTIDTIPFLVSERLIAVNKLDGARVEICGEFRSYNKKNEFGSKLLLFVFAKGILVDDVGGFCDENKIELNGFICRKPVCRKTPRGRVIADLFLAVNRNYGMSDYIPCIVWGRNAHYASTLDVGTNVRLSGRIQSRNYAKALPDGQIETRIAYEVSVCAFSALERVE